MSPRTAGIIAGGVVALLAAAWSYRAYLRSRPSPEELERRRRAALNAIGKIGDGTIVELQEKIIFYSYGVRGIEYMASQDVTALEALIPTDPWSLAGPVSVKYDPRNPANSIILSEEWTGIRKAKSTL